jgi:hypothetical protein
VKPRTEEILRRFAAKNGKSFSDLMDILAHIVSNYSTEKMFDDTIGQEDPRMGQFDILLREWMQDNTPEEYRKIPVLRRYFGRMFKPLTRQELERIDSDLAHEAEIGEIEDNEEVPEVEEDEVE